MPDHDPQREENARTQPRRRHRVFDNPGALSEGWYPVCAGLEAAHALPNPAGLETEISSVYRETTVLLAHHHLMMANGIDLRHFGSVHGLPVAFSHDVVDRGAGVFDWEVRGR